MSQAKGHVGKNKSVSAVRDGGVVKRNGQKAACDRCRGQKLRCIWDAEESQCRRCLRADTTCTVPLPRPMGRPPRQHRSTGSYNQDRIDTVYNWGRETPTAIISGGEGTVIEMDSNNNLADPLGFFNYYPDPGCLDELFAPDSPVATLPIMLNSSQSFEDHRSVDNLENTQAETNRREAKGDNHLLLAKGDDDHVQLLTHLGDLNVALFQHPLSCKDKATPRTMLTTRSMSRTPADDQCDQYPWSPDLSLSDLGIGKLLKMTTQLQGIVTRIQSLADGTPREVKDHDRSTALVALSCYTRLDILYSRTIEVLLQVRQDGGQLKNIHLLMPGLAINGFSMGHCHDLQLDLLIWLYKKAYERIHSCISGGNKALLSK